MTHHNLKAPFDTNLVFEMNKNWFFKQIINGEPISLNKYFIQNSATLATFFASSFVPVRDMLTIDNLFPA